ncbi:hypothetical protein EYF80_030711 [Liparis tanakae]|uniref:Uncharacterized protein n=1 Tax=Liparis tanakae TaxID=230148 RepID=A0A4Z2GZM4_9TELE|nr:hypothetical protein EYF80_030711 [Liparis tanakae]
MAMTRQQSHSRSGGERTGVEAADIAADPSQAPVLALILGLSTPIRRRLQSTATENMRQARADQHHGRGRDPNPLSSILRAPEITFG